MMTPREQLEELAQFLGQRFDEESRQTRVSVKEAVLKLRESVPGLVEQYVARDLARLVETALLKHAATFKPKDGENAIPWMPAGTYDETREYQRFDVVARDGGSYVAVKDRPGVLPGPDWKQLAGRGRAGKPGVAIKGDPGKPGRDGVGIVDIVQKDGQIIVMLSDGRNLPFTVVEPPA